MTNKKATIVGSSKINQIKTSFSKDLHHNKQQKSNLGGEVGVGEAGSVAVQQVRVQQLVVAVGRRRQQGQTSTATSADI